MPSRRMFWDIVDNIEDLIKSGQFQPGNRLPPERILAEQFNVSRPTIREAIIALEVKGLVEVKTSSGVYILDKVTDESSTLQCSSFEWVQAIAIIEGEVTSLAAKNLTTSELSILEHLFLSMKSEPNNTSYINEFHELLCKATKNKALAYAAQKLRELKLDDNTLSFYYESTNCSYDDYQKILIALRAKDGLLARSAIHEIYDKMNIFLMNKHETLAIEEIKKTSLKNKSLYSIINN